MGDTGKRRCPLAARSSPHSREKNQSSSEQTMTRKPSSGSQKTEMHPGKRPEDWADPRTVPFVAIGNVRAGHVWAGVAVPRRADRMWTSEVNGH